MVLRREPSLAFTATDTLRPRQVRRLWHFEILCQLAGVAAAVVRHGLGPTTEEQHVELGLVVILAMACLTASTAVQYRWSLARTRFLQRNVSSVLFGLLWLSGFVGILIFGPLLPEWNGQPTTRGIAFIACSELFILLQGLAGLVRMTRRAAGGGINPTLVLVLSFVFLTAVGTALLLLPRARGPAAPDNEPLAVRIRVAFFTATSASCVTGLTVVPTGGSNPYWSRMGQMVILGLFQIGGLGIMTCGAFFAVVAGRDMQLRESVTLRDLLDSEGLGDARRLLLSILGFTLIAESVGALLLSGLWSDLPGSERMFYSLFHSVSAFCNAGFSLTENSFEGLGVRWQVWGVLAGLIVTGGLGFAVLYNVSLVAKSRLYEIRFQPLFSLPQKRVRLSLSSKLVIVSSFGLLLLGGIGFYILESTGPPNGQGAVQRIADAWFQSVTFRTAGFNTVDHGELQAATKLFAIPLMIVGASPGSTGGGVKTICFALTVLSLISVLRGRQRVEVMGRTIPDMLVNRALAILTLGVLMIMSTTILLVLFENRPEKLIDYLFEATSAFATVGVSTGITPKLSAPSQLVIAVAMFIGRVGPLTLLIGLSGHTTDTRYDYPFERVTLG